jgi:hypothetical protein
MMYLSVTEKTTLEQAYTMAQMTGYRLEKSVDWSSELYHHFPHIRTLEAPTILGAFVWTQLSKKHRMIDWQHAYNYGAGWNTPADIARDYLAVRYPKRKPRMTTWQYDLLVRHRKSAPLAAKNCHLDHAVYLDIQSAYWQIVSAVGWDVDYNPNVWLGVNSGNEDFPFQHIKLARNCLVSCGLSSTAKMWTGDKLVSHKVSNPYLNLMLWGLVMDVLNTFAYDMLWAGAVYCHTDGFILPANCEKRAMAIADGWGLTLSKRHEGEALVRGIGDYDIGARMSRLKRWLNHGQFYRVQPTNPKWLRTKFKKCVLDREIRGSFH